MPHRIRGTTQIVGVWGMPVAHSASPAMHNAAFDALQMDWAYLPFAVDKENIGAAVAAIRALSLRGVNITVPHKESVAPYLNTISETARIIGSVNTIVHRADGHLHGDSTDGAGFIAALKYAQCGDLSGKKAVVLGAGGSARAVVYALLCEGVRVVLVNRTIERAQSIASDFAAYGNIAVCPSDEAVVAAQLADSDLLVNTTSAGMHPEIDILPPAIGIGSLHNGLFVTDLIYNPWQTILLKTAEQCGCRTQNGAEMLVRQGAISFRLWTGIEPPVDTMRAAVAETVEFVHES